MEPERIEVYTDGQCPLCQWVRAKVEPYDTDQRIDWIDYHDTEGRQRASPFTIEELAAEMHARTDARGWTKGYRAWVEVLRVLPRWRWLAAILAAWPATFLGPVFYRWIASRRYTLFGVPPPCDESGVCQLHTPKQR